MYDELDDLEDELDVAAEEAFYGEEEGAESTAPSASGATMADLEGSRK